MRPNYAIYWHHNTFSSITETRLICIIHTCYHSITSPTMIAGLHPRNDKPPSWLYITSKMPCSKKKSKCPGEIPNYSVFNYVDKLPPFSESDRFLETKLNQLPCHNEYELEALLSRFSDAMLNDHLYLMYKKGRLDNPLVMR